MITQTQAFLTISLREGSISQRMRTTSPAGEARSWVKELLATSDETKRRGSDDAGQ